MNHAVSMSSNNFLILFVPDQKLLPSAMLKSDLVSIAHDMQDLAEMVPDFHINGVQR